MWLSNYFSTKKIDDLRSVQDKIYVDLMASEVQFSLLQESSCKDVSTTVLSSELNSLADKISYSESNIGTANDDVISLKKYYSVLEIKDYLLMKKITEQCGNKPIFVLYFYKNDNCADCTKQGFVLTSMREKYPNLRVYSFDETLNLPVIKTLTSVYKVKDSTLPALVINGRVYPGFQSVESIEKILPELKKTEKKGTTGSTSTIPEKTIDRTVTDTKTSNN
jgi:hypothetical protein